MAFKTLQYWQNHRNDLKKLYSIASSGEVIPIKTKTGITKKEKIRYEKENIRAIEDFISNKTNECFIHTGVMVGTPVQNIDIDSYFYVPSPNEINSIARQCTKSRTAINKISFEKDINQKPPTIKKEKQKTKTAQINGKRNELGHLLQSSAARGSIKTATFEALAAFYCAVLSETNLPYKKITKEILLKYSHKVTSDRTVHDAFNIIEEKTFFSCYKQARKIKSLGYLTSSISIHVDGETRETKEMISKIKKLLLDTNLELPSSTNINKWNTADIWIIKNGFNINTLMEDNIFLTNSNFIAAAKQKNIIGISLKLIESISPSASKVNFEANSIIYYPTEIKPIHINRKVFTNQGFSIQLNGNNYMKFGIMGHGKSIKAWTQPATKKTGGGGGDFGVKLFDYIISKTKVNIPNSSQIRQFVQKVKKDQQEIIRIINEIDPYIKYTAQDLAEEKSNRDERKFYDKITALYILYHFTKLSMNDKIKFTKMVMQMGPAENDWSGPFIKIY